MKLNFIKKNPKEEFERDKNLLIEIQNILSINKENKDYITDEEIFSKLDVFNVNIKYFLYTNNNEFLKYFKKDLEINKFIELENLTQELRNNLKNKDIQMKILKVIQYILSKINSK